MDAVWKDPDTFRPDRWFEELPSSDDLPSGWSHLLAFSDGPRSCIGMRLGEHCFCVVVYYMSGAYDRDLQAIYNYKVRSLSRLSPDASHSHLIGNAF